MENHIAIAVNALNDAKNDFNKKLEMFEYQIKLRRKQVAEIEKEIKSMDELCEGIVKRMTDIDNVIGSLTKSFNLQPVIENK